MNIPRNFALLALAIVAAPCIGSNPMRGGQAPAFPPEFAAHIPSNVEPYFLAFLVNDGEPKEMTFDLFVRHQAYLRRQFEAGVYRLAGPLMDEGRIRGALILSAGSADEARAIVEGDPAVQEGIFAVEVHPALFPSLASLRVEYPARD